ncbi:hypothetical protein V2A60_009225 [Cordyceps javanica]|uniref:Uncharacterized protein n=1 Tax=Cordyceps javanica TaxID=43265 RepID=A0A545UTH3_9HYPO|nr:hypothetical protein IF1G_08686 [Cordyceps javanica]TQW03277.1 hypothetical protein IF2G_09006 [Cordyceps javanica]
MVATKLVLAALAAYVSATPVDSAPAPASTQWTALKIADSDINWDGVDMQAYHDPANWKQDSSNETAVAERVSPNPAAAAKGDLSILSGPCSQGDCPDYNAAFDLVYTFTAVPLPPDPNCPGCPPLTIFSSNSDIRVNDCGQCLRKKVGSSLGGEVPGGCYDFKACGRDQVICVDPGKYRAHRIWKDNGHKTCYNMKADSLGMCGFVKSRIISHPTGETACNW